MRPRGYLQKEIMKKITIALGAIFLSCVLLLSSAAFAEDEETNNVNAIKRETAAVKKTAEASKKAAEKIFPESELTFANILKHPDDVMLNFEYAKSQVNRNDMLGAAATLERILMVNSNFDQARLFRAVVLYRLDNLTEAKNEIDILDKREMSPALRKELGRYKKEINKRQRRTHFSLMQSNAWQFDSNRNAVPSSKQRLFGNTRLPVAPADRSRRDPSFLNITTLDVHHDLGFQAGHELVGSFTYFLQEQGQLDNLDLQSFAYDLGATYKSKWVNITPLFTASHLFLLSDNFLRTQGGSVVIEHDFGRLNLHHISHLEHQDYLLVKAYQTSDQQSGNEYDMTHGAAFTLSPSMSIYSDIGFTHKKAKEEFNSYDRIALDLGHTWLWPKGQFVINTVTAGYSEYDEPDLAIASRERLDRSLRYRSTYGTPLGTLLFPLKKILPEQVKDVIFTFTYEYYRVLSNITNYTYHNNKIQFLWTKKWEF